MATRKGKNAKVSQIHQNKKRYRRSDVHEGVTYGDWYEQDLAEMNADLSNHQVNPPQEKKK